MSQNDQPASEIMKTTVKFSNGHYEIGLQGKIIHVFQLPATSSSGNVTKNGKPTREVNCFGPFTVHHGQTTAKRYDIFYYFGQ